MVILDRSVFAHAVDQIDRFLAITTDGPMSTAAYDHKDHSPKGVPWALVMGTVWHQSPLVLLLVQPAVTSAPPEVDHSPMVMLPHELHVRQCLTSVLVYLSPSDLLRAKISQRNNLVA